MTTILASAFVLGLLGSVHCAAMCGPIALAVPGLTPRGWQRLVGAWLMNSGRVLVYALFGVVLGSAGRALDLFGLQQTFSIGAGVLLLLSLVVPLGGHILAGSAGRIIIRLRTRMAGFLKARTAVGMFSLGALNALLPCGLVYLALVGAMAQSGPLIGAAFMAAFGLGTWPLLIGLHMGSAILSPQWRGRLRRLAPVAVAVMGFVLILRGMGLGIPYFSPMNMGTAGVAGCP
ncbi:MAG: sulfite exporter TauE/SafE family protein [Flavobacteriales bacterium]|nr:sulfite exporter TauE/SafE family protein [Flavobacteriales bacterium]